MARVISTRRELPRLARELAAESVKLARDEVIPVVHREAEKHFRRTTQYWGDSGVNRFRRPQPKIETQVEASATKGARIRIRIVAWDSQRGIPSRLWHWLDGGTQSRTQRRNSPPIPERRAHRTHPNVLDVNPFPGFTGRFFVIRAGTLVQGIPARRWYEAISDETRRTTDAAVKRAGFRFGRRQIER